MCYWEWVHGGLQKKGSNCRVGSWETSSGQWPPCWDGDKEQELSLVKEA